ncbi:succinate dehydrogenase/fumarate reductase, flavoprotein subunit [Pelotomaculum thermopropionicum SI]|uniref:Succinate dehydrogenase/fumarate reductase, flavoprotein subunit n=1 Tax=Pelotomaculum thermopropionicum (strain DSM 13744 / JCM 10971 / SI) TaxID=370438 RepID=A5D5R5_PELTS|nr:succinate dehydrogenase/fumarate reductase, flavoprotein subunit [Pelotomaculum thermopropionicum SI]
MNAGRVKIERKSADIVIVGGGTAGCFAAVTIKEMCPSADVLVVEKAHVKRSGCLAAGVNAINAYLGPGETPESYLDYVKRDSAGLVREDLVLSIGQRLNRVTEKLESWGLPFLKDESGRYKFRGKRSVEINGEHIKPVIASALRRSGAGILNRAVATNYVVKDGRAAGVFAFSAREEKFYVISAKAVICAAGGAAGIYRPNNGGPARHKMWYCPFNVGTGFAMGLRAGAEMTTFEMRFIALRIKDVLSPTGTVVQGVKARQINALGEEYLNRYGSDSTPVRLYATVEENKAGRGPCYLDLTGLPDSDNSRLKEAYLNMSPGIVLKWADEGVEPNGKPLEICGSEPYVVGGHGQAGYWVDSRRRTTLEGLFAAGDAAGGAPKKYVSGCLAEGEIAALAALEYIRGIEVPAAGDQEVAAELGRVFEPLGRQKGAAPDDYEERLQKIMDEYAGGISANYELSGPKLLIARELLRELQDEISANISAGDMHELVKAHEVIDRALVARVLVEHLLYRKETRWRSYQERVDYPVRDDRRWLVFVNSVYDGETKNIRIIERPWKGLG